MPLKDEGAYLVVCRGDDLHASGLVLVTPLAVEVQEDAVSGRVRTTVKDVKADRYVNNVQVKVIGSGNDDFVAGDTDLRGVFVADGIHGRSTVIARAEPSRYAFFRGTDGSGRRRPPREQPAPPTPTRRRPSPPPACRSRCRRKSSCCEGLEQQNRTFPVASRWRI